MILRIQLHSSKVNCLRETASAYSNIFPPEFTTNNVWGMVSMIL